MTPFKSGDRVVIFNSSDPDDALERIVGRVTKNTIRLKGDAPASSWSSNGRHKYFESVRLLRPEDLPAAQEEARREKADCHPERFQVEIIVGQEGRDESK